jgi:hypothetical protein
VSSLVVPAHADFNLYPYTLNSSCGSSIDPINFVFYGVTAYTSSADNHLGFQTGWGDRSGSTQYRSSHGYCTAMSYQRASSCSTCSRYHARIFSTHHQDTLGRYESGLDAHHEDFVWTCFVPNHAVDSNGSNGSGFDQGRRKLYDYFAGSHHAYGDTQYWGNTRNFKQCDGDYAGSNGYVHWFAINGGLH